jgi:hypothetical protein
MSRLGTSTGNETVDNYLRRQPQEPFEWPLHQQLNACASPAERELVLEGYTGAVSGDWRAGLSYWRDEDSPQFLEGVHTRTRSPSYGPASMTDRLTHLSVEESESEGDEYSDSE